MEEVRRYLSPIIQVRRGDVLSAWSGWWPFVLNPNAQKEGTEGLVRNHLMTVSQSGLVTIAVEMVDVGSYGGGDGRLGC